MSQDTFVSKRARVVMRAYVLYRRLFCGAWEPPAGPSSQVQACCVSISLNELLLNAHKAPVSWILLLAFAKHSSNRCVLGKVRVCVACYVTPSGWAK
jgi:hypothetical protein